MRPVGRRYHCVSLAEDKEGREKENTADRLSKQIATATLKSSNLYCLQGPRHTFFRWN